MNSLTRMLKIAELYFDAKDEKGFKQICAYFNSYLKRYAHMEPKNDGTTPNPWKFNMDYAEYENSPYFGSISEFMEKFPGGIKDWVVWRNKTKKQRNTMYNDLLPGPKKALNKMANDDGENMKKDLREELSDLEHKQWMEWAKSILKSEDISEDRAKRWKEECFKPYDKLSEEMKDFDREWADKVLKIVEKHNKTEKKAHYEPVGGDDVAKFEKEQPLYSDKGLEKFKSIKEFLKQYREEGQSADDAATRAVKDMINYWKLLLKGKKRRKQKGKK